MVTCKEKLSGLANTLVFDYTGEISVEQNDEEDDYLKVTAGDTVNFNNILKNVRNNIGTHAKSSEYTYLTKIDNNQLFVKIVDEEVNDEDTDWIVS